MGYNDHLNDSQEELVICPKCRRKYLQWTRDQVPGFRDMDYDTCPYCGNERGKSMTIEFHNQKLNS